MSDLDPNYDLRERICHNRAEYEAFHKAHNVPVTALNVKDDTTDFPVFVRHLYNDQDVWDCTTYFYLHNAEDLLDAKRGAVCTRCEAPCEICRKKQGYFDRDSMS